MTPDETLQGAACARARKSPHKVWTVTRARRYGGEDKNLWVTMGLHTSSSCSLQQVANVDLPVG